MTEENHTENQETLGEYLYRLRNERNIALEDIQEETKIPPRTLRAIEADDYSQLPADAFARGFYVLYAKYLELEPTEILERLDNEREGRPSGGKFSPPSREGKKVNTMAARPSMATASNLGFSLVVIIALAALLCWYFGWNPATYLSEKLRSFQEPVTSEMQINNGTEAVSSADSTTQEIVESKHFLTVDFLEDTTITITIDNGLPVKEVYSKGSTRSWYANTSISLIMPENAQVELFFNGAEIAVPSGLNGLISVDLP